jgi:hypothetical protein
MHGPVEGKALFLFNGDKTRFNDEQGPVLLG